MQQIIRFISKTSVLFVLGILCILILIVGYYKDKQAQLVVRHVQVDPTITKYPSSSLSQKDSNSKKFDINGSYECKSASSSAFIEHKKLYVENITATTSSYILFRGDCLYTWQQKQYKGQKTCGLGQFINLYEMFKGTKIDLVSVSQLVGGEDIISKFLNQKVDGVDLSLLKSCKEAVVDNALFQVPNKIIFETAQKK